MKSGVRNRCAHICTLPLDANPFCEVPILVTGHEGKACMDEIPVCNDGNGNNNDENNDDDSGGNNNDGSGGQQNNNNLDDHDNKDSGDDGGRNGGDGGALHAGGNGALAEPFAGRNLGGLMSQNQQQQQLLALFCKFKLHGTMLMMSKLPLIKTGCLNNRSFRHLTMICED